MDMINLRKLGCLCLGLLLAVSVYAERPKTLLITSDFRHMTALFLNAHVRLQFDHEARIRTQPASVLDDYGTIMLFVGSDLDASEEQVRAYLESGGNVVVVGEAAETYVKKYQGLFGWRAQYGAVPGYGITYRDHPLLKKPGAGAIEAELDDTLDALVVGDDDALGDAMKPVDDEDDPQMALPGAPQARDWPATPLQDSLIDAEGGESVIANDNHACLWVKTFGPGNGRLIFMAEAMCPAFLRESHWKFATRSNDAFLARLWTYLGVPRIEAVTSVDRPIWWYRPTTSLEGARRSWPRQPQPDEIVTQMRIQAGMDELERRMVYLSLPATPKSVSLRQPAEGPQITLGLQDAPTPDYVGPLVYVRWLQPRESIAATAPVITCWLQVDTAGLAPGEHRQRIELIADDRVVPLDVVVDVAPVRIPQDHKFLVDYEYFILRLNYPHDYQDSWPVNWGELGIDVLLSGQMPMNTLAERLMLTDGRSLLDAARTAPEPIGAQLPPLDFTQTSNGRFDEFIQTGVSNNLLSFRTYNAFGLQPTNVVELTQALYRDPSITEESPEVIAVLQEYVRQAHDFLRSKGIRQMYSKRFDEWREDATDGWLQLARPMAAAGWANMGNPTVRDVLLHADKREPIYPYLHAIWLQGNGEHWEQITREAPVTPHPGGYASGYMSFNTSSNWWDSSVYSGMRTLWASAWRRDMGYHRHGWGTRGTYAAAGVYPLDATWRRVFPNAGMLIASEAVDDARYGILLQDMIDTIRTHDPAKADELTAGWHAIIDDSDEALLPVWDVRVDADATPTLAIFYEARARLFTLLQEAQAALPPTQPSLSWNGLPIIADGSSSYCILAESGLADHAVDLQRLIQASTGVSLPILAEPADGQPAIRLTRPATAAAVFAPLITEHYPAPGAYIFLNHADGDLWVIAREPETHQQAVTNLLKSCWLSPRWYTPTPLENTTP